LSQNVPQNIIKHRIDDKTQSHWTKNVTQTNIQLQTNVKLNNGL